MDRFNSMEKYHGNLCNTKKQTFHFLPKGWHVCQKNKTEKFQNRIQKTIISENKKDIKVYVISIKR